MEQELGDGWADGVHPDDLNFCLSTYLAAFQARLAFEMEYRLRNQQGEYRWIEDCGKPLYDLEGNFAGYIGTCFDVTQRKRAEEALLRLAAIAEQSSDAIIGKSLAGIVTSWNRGAERIYGFAAEEIVGHPISILTPPESHDEIGQILERIGRGERVEHYETVRMRKDGRRIHISLSVSPIKDAFGKIVGATAIARDVTARKRADEKLRATTEQLRALSASVQAAREAEGTRISREIHDELGAALSSLKWGLEDVNDAVSASRDGSQLSGLRAKVDAMMRLTDTTINTVRRIASELRPIALDALGLSEAVECQAAQFRERTGIMVQCDCAVENLDLSREQTTNAFRILQEALTNILRHAQATKVKIQMKQEESEFILTIADNGRGMTADAVGTQSLGLLGMRERANLIDGDIRFTGDAASGTTVTLRIPVPGLKSHEPAETLLTLSAPARGPHGFGRSNEKNPHS